MKNTGNFNLNLGIIPLKNVNGGNFNDSQKKYFRILCLFGYLGK